MNWKNLTIGKKISIGFTIILALLALVAVWSISGVGNIVTNAEEVIDGNKLRAEMIQREIDHLNWANQLNALLTDIEITELKVETDAHKCAFGKWYYGEGLQKYRHIPEMQALEAPHERLHRLIKDIIDRKNAGREQEARELFKQIDPLSREIVGLLDSVQQHTFGEKAA